MTGERSVPDGVAVQLVALCFDANDPLGLARFWAEALRWEVGHGSGDEIGLEPTDGTRFRIRFRPVPEAKAGRSRLHVDLTTTSIEDQEQTVTELIALGASPIDIGQRPDERHVVLADPEGNEFCVLEPENAFLAGCGRLGSITCDGTREVGYFWSEALGWPLVWDQDDETAIRAPGGTGSLITWGGPVPPTFGKNRLHLDVAPPRPADLPGSIDRLVALGATQADISQGDVGWVVMADPDGNEFWVSTS